MIIVCTVSISLLNRGPRALEGPKRGDPKIRQENNGEGGAAAPLLLPPQNLTPLSALRASSVGPSGLATEVPKAYITIAIRLRYDYDTSIPRSIRLRYNYYEKLTCSFFARVELEAGARDTS